jgi:hypothetical protein
MRNEHEHSRSTPGAEEEALSAALRREADELPYGPAPVAAIMHAGRRRARRGRTAAGAVAAAVVAVLAAPLLTEAGSPGTDTGPALPAATFTAPSAAPRTPLHTLAPSEPVTVAPDMRLALLAEGRQNYLLQDADDFAQDLEQRRSPLFGDNIRPRSISSGYQASDTDGVRWVSGVWRLPERPARIVVTAAGRDRPADLYTLGGTSGWGVYVLDARPLPRFTSYTVTAYDARGEVFDTLEVDVGLGPDR